MMKNQSVIRDMFFGKQGNMDAIKSSRAYKEKLAVTVALDKELQTKLADLPELADLYEKFSDAVLDENSENVLDYYTAGFRFGLLLGLEVAKAYDCE